MTTNGPKKKGTAFETALVDHINAAGFPARRVALAGSADCGDVHVVDGDGDLHVIEAKNRKGYAIAEAVDQAKREAANAGSTFPVAVLKRNGVGDVGRSFVVMELDDWLALLPPYHSHFAAAATHQGTNSSVGSGCDGDHGAGDAGTATSGGDPAGSRPAPKDTHPPRCLP